MAITGSQYNFITFGASGDALALTRKVLLAGFTFAKPNVTTQVTVRVVGSSPGNPSAYSQFDIIPTSIFASAVQPPPIIFDSPQPVCGLKVTTATNVSVTAILAGGGY